MAKKKKGIELEFISKGVLAQKNGQEKIDYILDRIKEDKILVVEESLTPSEEWKLIESTMGKVNDRFPGVEISTLRSGKGRSGGSIRERLIKLLGGSIGGLTVIGPSKFVKEIKKDPQRISLLASDE